MYAEIYPFASDALDSIEPFPRIAFTYGMFTLTIHFGRLRVVAALLQLLGDIWKCTSPISYGLTHVSFTVSAYVVLSVQNGPRGRKFRTGGRG